MSRSILATLALLTLPVMAPAVRAATLHVPDDYPNIQAALDAAQPGDEVAVGPGTWTHLSQRSMEFDDGGRIVTAVAFIPAGVSLVSEAGADATTLRLETSISNGHVVVTSLLDGPDPVFVAGFRLEKLSEDSPAVLIHENPVGAAVTIDECTFADLRSDAEMAAGISCLQGGDLEVSRCVFDDVDADCGFTGNHCYGAVWYLGDGSLRVTDCDFVGCDGRGVSAWGSQLTVEGCSFTDCRAATAGSGIRTQSADALIEDCDFTGCVGVPVSLEAFGAQTGAVRECRFTACSGDGAGAISSGARDTTIEDCRFEDCHGSSSGAVLVSSVAAGTPVRIRRNVFRAIRTETFAALYVSGGSLGTVQSNTFVGCSSSGEISSACAYLTPSSSGPSELSGNIFASSQGSRPAVVAYDAAMLTADCNLYWDNDGGDFGGFVPGPGSLFEDPRFCDPEAADYSLQWGSPCLPANSGGCGLIGVFGFGGCNSIAVEPESWGRIKGLWRR
jgi:hypothetical protein